jgi:hypothetical protein
MGRAAATPVLTNANSSKRSKNGVVVTTGTDPGRHLLAWGLDRVATLRSVASTVEWTGILLEMPIARAGFTGLMAGLLDGTLRTTLRAKGVVVHSEFKISVEMVETVP